MQPEPATAAYADLREYLGILRMRMWGIAATTVIVMGSALAFSLWKVPIYQSEARILVDPSVTTIGVAAPPVNLDTERALVDSTAVATLVWDNLDAQLSPDALLRPLEVTVEASTEILSVRYSDPDPLRAQRFAQGFADAYIQFRQEQVAAIVQAQVASIQDGINGVQKLISSLERKISEAKGTDEQNALSAERDSAIARLGVLQQKLEDLRSATTVKGGGKIIQAAALPDAPSSPNPVLDAAVGLIAGLALGIGVAFLRERLDDRLRGRGDLEEQLGAPVLATVARVKDWRRKTRTELVTLSAPDSSSSEAFRTLRTNLLFIAQRDGIRVLSVTSPVAGEGKTTVVANLAVVLAQTGKQVIAVSCDLRKPRLHQFFGLNNTVGVSTTLLGKTTLSDAIQRPKIANLLVLASGPIPPNPTELFSFEHLPELLKMMSASADFVILDLPPTLAVADALSIAPQSDGLIVIGNAPTTTRTAIAHTRQQLEQVGVNIIGGVLNNVDRSRAHYYPYHESGPYGYGPDRGGTGGRRGKEAASPRAHGASDWG